MGFRHEPGTHHLMGYSNYGMFWLIIVGILFLIILFLVYKLIKDNKQPPAQVKTTNEALNILQKRYAKGELTDKEFVQKREMLESSKSD